MDYKALYEEAERARREAEKEAENAAALYEESERARREAEQEAENAAALYEEAGRARREEERARRKAELEAETAMALREESERARREAERGRREAEAGQREEKRQKLEALVQAELDRQAAIDGRRALAALQREVAELRRSQANQALLPYLALVSRLHTHLMRLIPLPKLDHPSSTSSSVTTTGRTTIVGKYYPLAIRAWTEFPTLHKNTFSRILTATADRSNFPSLADLRVHEEDILQLLPRELLRAPKFLTENKTSAFLEIALHKPAARVLHRFLEATHVSERLFFNCDSATRTAESTGTASGPSSAGPAPSVPPQTASPPNMASPKASLKATPDCVVLAMSAGEPVAQSVDELSRPPRWVAVGEHKPCHALRHAVVTQIVQGPLPEAYIVRLARETKARIAKAQAQQSQSQTPHQQGSARKAAEDTGLLSPSGSAKGVPRQVYFAHALTQTYHYMLVSGLEYGFLATGETLTFLRIPENDPRTLLYHTSVFPVPTPENISSFSDPVITAPPFTATDPADEEALFDLPVAQLCTLSLLAREAAPTPRNALWISHALSALAPFPSLPLSVATVRDAPSPLGRRPRESDDSGSGSDNGDADDNSRQPRRRMLQPPGPRHASQVRTPSPLQRVSSADDSLLERAPAPGSSNFGQWMRERGVARKPRLPYCTQACLLGLVQEGPLDPTCPNALLHAGAAGAAAADTASTKHPITQGRLAALVRAQLFNGPEYDIECLSDKGYSGAVGDVLKITVTAYGYTFLAKGVEQHHRRRLRREARMYEHLRPQQGSIVPVCLGLVKLVAPYPVPQSFRILPTLLLLAYGGESVVVLEQKQQLFQEEQARKQAEGEQQPQGGDANTAVLPAGVDLDREAARTLDELGRLGFYDRDDNRANLLWCAETRRVMRIDFERAVWLGGGDGDGEHSRADGRASKRDHDSDSTERPGKRTKRRSSEASDADVDADGSDNT